VNGHAAKNSVPRPQSGQAGVALKLSEGHVRPQRTTTQLFPSLKAGIFDSIETTWGPKNTD